MRTVHQIARKGPSLVYEHLMLWNRDDLSEMYFNHLGQAAPNDREQAAKRLGAWFVAGVSDERIKLQTAMRVATAIVLRWDTAGAAKWRRDGAGLPVPNFGALQRSHTIKPTYKFSPSGKAMFGCWSCHLASAPSVRSEGACLGKRVFGAEHDLMLALAGGADYQLVTGIPLPTAKVFACTCCLRVGAWTQRDLVFKELVCPICFDDSVEYMHNPKRSFPNAGVVL